MTDDVAVVDDTEDAVATPDGVTGTDVDTDLENDTDDTEDDDLEDADGTADGADEQPASVV